MAEVKKMRIFLSYARKDVARVNELYRELKRYGFSPWQDHKDLLGGREWIDEIIETIKNCAFFVVCISQNTVDGQTGGLVREITEVLELTKFPREDPIFVIPVRLEKDVYLPEEFSGYHAIDLFHPEGLKDLSRALRKGLTELGFATPLLLRSRPLENLSPADVTQMIKERDFYADNYWNGKGIHHEYEPLTIDGEPVIMDHTTGLTWRQGSKGRMSYQNAENYIAELNARKFAGFEDWRLPTLEEALSLMEARKNENGLYIAPIFEKRQTLSSYAHSLRVLSSNGGGCRPGLDQGF